MNFRLLKNNNWNIFWNWNYTSNIKVLVLEIEPYTISIILFGQTCADKILHRFSFTRLKKKIKRSIKFQHVDLIKKNKSLNCHLNDRNNCLRNIHLETFKILNRFFLNNLHFWFKNQSFREFLKQTYLYVLKKL